MQQLNLEILMAILSITNNTLLISLIAIFSQWVITLTSIIIPLTHKTIRVQILIIAIIPKMDLQEVGGGCEDWMELAQDRDRWRALVSMVMNLWVPKIQEIS